MYMDVFPFRVEVDREEIGYQSVLLTYTIAGEVSTLVLAHALQQSVHFLRGFVLKKK
jgi:hypothetical protein